MRPSLRPLANMRVLDFTTTIAGPYCARLLADLGAEVIKIEAPEGDMMRTRPPLRDGASTSYGQLNAGKKSIALDLKRAEAIRIVQRLVAKTDILVENFRPGVMKRLGLHYDVLKPLKPDLIYCAISGYGQTGPSAELPAYAPAIHAAAGYDLGHLAYQPGRERPDNCGIYIADVMTGTFAFGAIMTAIVQRQATGQGQLVDVSMLETMLALMVSEVQAAQFHVAPPGRPMFGPVATKDGYIMPAVAAERTFQGICRAAGREDWITDPRFAAYTNRRNNWGAFIDELEVWSRTVTTAECQAAFDRNGVPNSPYRTVAEALADPQIAHREALARVRDRGGSFQVINAPFRLSGAETSVRDFAVGLGENTLEILSTLGYADNEIDALAADGIIGMP
jgi:CoA:oxalate CoA-transferase